MFLLKKNVKIFFFHKHLVEQSLFMWWLREFSLKILFPDILRMIGHIEFECDTINFHKQWMYPTKYQHLGIAPLNTFKVKF